MCKDKERHHMPNGNIIELTIDEHILVHKLENELYSPCIARGSAKTPVLIKILKLYNYYIKHFNFIKAYRLKKIIGSYLKIKFNYKNENKKVAVVYPKNHGRTFAKIMSSKIGGK